MHRFGIIVVIILIVLVGCRPQVAHQAEPLPTFQPTPTSPADLEAADRIARLYLDAWRRQDFDTMQSSHPSAHDQYPTVANLCLQISRDPHCASVRVGMTKNQNTHQRQDYRH